jgi:hypothetical protein
VTRRPRLTLLGFAALVGIASACELDETAGLSRTLGDPLLDITLGPAGDAVYPTATHDVTLSAGSTQRDTLTLTLRNLGPLPAGAVYQVYVVDSSTVDAGGNNLTPVGGRLIRQTRIRRPIDRDNTVIEVRTDTTAAATAITSADTNQTFIMRIATPVVRTGTHVVVGIAPAAQTAATRLDRTTRFGFLASRYRTGTTFANTGTTTFGSWAINTARRLPFIPSSATINGAFRGSTVRLNIRDLIRPPVGFRYAAWVIDTRTGAAARLGGLMTPVPSNRSLDDADVGQDGFLTDVAMIEAQMRGDTASAGNVRWENFTRIDVLLEPKGSAPPTMPGGAFVLSGPVPQSVASRSPGAGKVSGTVTSTSNGNRTGATIFLTGVNDRIPKLVTNASATGTFLFRTVSIGQYRAFVVPPGGSTATDSVNVTIGTREVDGVTVGDSVGIALRIP